LPWAEAEVAQRRYEAAEQNAEFYEKRAVEAERDSDHQFKLRAQAEAALAEAREHEEQTHAELSAILGTDDSLLECAKRLKSERCPYTDAGLECWKDEGMEWRHG